MTQRFIENTTAELTKLRTAHNGRRGLCFETLPGFWAVRLFQQGINRFTVQYGKQVDYNLTYTQACSKLGAAIMHDRACAGELDNREHERATA